MNISDRARVLLLFALIVAGVFQLSSCHASKSAATAKRYAFTGRVVSIDVANRSAIIDGDNIPGFMEAMAMSYQIKPPETLKQLSPGDSISAELVDIQPNDAGGSSESWLENVKVTAHGKNPAAIPTTGQHVPTAGDSVPDFAFINQDGRQLSLAQYHGKVLLVTFIYTRCPFPDFCPRMSGNFAEIEKQLGSNPNLSSVHLLSISFDPEHDKPATLRDYGFEVAHTHNPSIFRRWEFVAPKTADLPRIADFFALSYKPEGGTITHNLSTAVIGPDGKIVSWYHGSDWQVSDLIKDAVGATVPKASGS